MATVTSARLQPWAEEVGRGRVLCASMTVTRRPPASGALDDGGESPVALRWRYVGVTLAGSPSTLPGHDAHLEVQLLMLARGEGRG